MGHPHQRQAANSVLHPSYLSLLLVGSSQVIRIDKLRVIQDAALSGPENMGRDEALLACVGRGASPPTLRLYQWDPPTISLGYFQRYADYESLAPPAGDLAVVRRHTGGGAILHDRELTYALALPMGHELMADGPNVLYDTTHKAIIACLADAGLMSQPCGQTDDSGAAKGPFFCFERRHCYDVLIGVDKLVGSAQRRTKDAVLQHGSIILGRRFEQQTSARIDLPPSPLIDTLRKVLPEKLSVAFGVGIEAGDWSEEELEEAMPLVEKHAGDEWLRRT